MTNDDLLLVGDIGGTNARFALKTTDGRTIRFATSEVANHPTFEGALEAFLAEGEETPRPHRACIAVAGPVTGGRAAFTNSPWTIDAVRLEQVLAFDQVCVVNDFAALGRFALARRPEDVVCVKPGRAIVGAPVVVLGPGTGLGQAIAVPTGGGCSQTLSTEGGHCILPAVDAEEAEILATIAEDLGRPPTNEDVVSGIGLVRLHAACLRIAGSQAAENTTPADVTHAALAGEPGAVRTAAQFLRFLGTIASNAALGTGARGGVLLAGGILPRIVALIGESGFSDRFVGESLMGDYLSAIPVDLVNIDDAALRGALAYLQEDQPTEG